MGALACRPRSVYNVKSQIFTFCIQRLPFLAGTSTTRNYSKFALYNNLFGLAVSNIISVTVKINNRELKQATFLTTLTPTGSESSRYDQ